MDKPSNKPPKFLQPITIKDYPLSVFTNRIQAACTESMHRCRLVSKDDAIQALDDIQELSDLLNQSLFRLEEMRQDIVINKPETDEKLIEEIKRLTPK